MLASSFMSKQPLSPQSEAAAVVLSTPQSLSLQTEPVYRSLEIPCAAPGICAAIALSICSPSIYNLVHVLAVDFAANEVNLHCAR
eukprot:scaffold4058_cov257-Pinguiococcus_pyrenoidosus.AAC.13